MHWNDNLEVRKLVLDAITVPPPENVDLLVQELPNIPTNFTEQSNSSEANSCLASHEIPSILWNLSSITHVHKSLPLVPILGQVISSSHLSIISLGAHTH
jgi:hypothetical protein